MVVGFIFCQFDIDLSGQNVSVTQRVSPIVRIFIAFIGIRPRNMGTTA